MRVKDVDFKEFLNEVQKNSNVKIDKKALQNFYNENKNRQYNIALKYARSLFQQLKAKRAIVVGENKTRYGQHFLVAYDLNSKSLISLNVPDPTEFNLLEEVEYIGRERSGIVYCTKIESKGSQTIDKLTYEEIDEECEWDEILVPQSKLIVLLKELQCAIYEGIDWDEYEKVRNEVKFSDAPRLSVLLNDKVNFAISTMLDPETFFTIYFNNIDVRFMNDIITQDDAELTAAQLEEIVNGENFLIPLFVSKITEGASTDGRIRTKINARAFGLIYFETEREQETTPDEVEDEEITIIDKPASKPEKEKLEQKRENKGYAKYLKKKLDKAIAYIKKYKTVSIESLQKETNLDEAQTNNLIKELLKQDIITILDLDTIEYVEQEKTERDEQIEEARNEVNELTGNTEEIDENESEPNPVEDFVPEIEDNFW